jgi:hypothetical protein
VNGFIAEVGTAPVVHSTTEETYGDAMRLLGGTTKRVAESATSSIGSRARDASEIATLIGQVEAASSIDGLTEGGVSLDALGGAVADVAPARTAFT